ncbi:hypothetical protein PIROE2DRAFT_12390 [Piromyces sp. E2]|nr:hypothetical protein PIROE2DRAFT_12390 [Piromyces sp. E2]|eukprot:OUM61569.1 hypothetical protein PIROE2DRAFT_12390 [Piromyces sp. E2]
MIAHLYFAITARFKVNLTDKEIYIYDEEFNKQIKDKLNFIATRKILLFVCTFVATITIIIHIVLIWRSGSVETKEVNFVQPTRKNSQDSDDDKNNDIVEVITY